MDLTNNITKNMMEIPSTHKQVFENTFSNTVDKTKIVTAKYNGAISDRDIAILEFLFKFRFATAEQIFKYLELTLGNNDEYSLSSLKSRLDKLIKSYRAVNKFFLAPSELSVYDGEVEFYCLDLGGLFLLKNFTDQPLDKILNWRPKVANLHTAEAVVRDYRIADFYLKVLDIFGKDLVNFECYKRMTFNKQISTVTFDFCVERDDVRKYFVGEIVNDADLFTRFPASADSLGMIFGSNTWRKYYETLPTFLYIAETEESALEISTRLAIQNLENVRITTVDRLEEGDLSIAFMIFDQENQQLRVGRSKFFMK